MLLLLLARRSCIVRRKAARLSLLYKCLSSSSSSYHHDGDDHDDGFFPHHHDPLISINDLPKDSYYQELAAQGRRPRVLIDVRPKEAFDRLHIKGSISMPLPELASRLYELPSPYEDVIDLGGSCRANVRTAQVVLQSAGWRCRVVYQDDGPSLESCIAERRRRTQQQGHNGPLSSAVVSHVRPNPFLEMVGSTLIDWSAMPKTTFHPTTLLDLGCGGGRDAIYLAQKALSSSSSSSSPYTPVVYAVDNHGDALFRVQSLAMRAGLDNIIMPTHMDLRRPQAGKELEKALMTRARRSNEDHHAAAAAAATTEGKEGKGKAWIVHASRFLERRLLYWLRDGEGLESGGYLIWSTFMEGGKESNRVPPYRPGRRLMPGELGSFFRQGPFEILHDSEGQLVTRGVGVPASFFVARKSVCRRDGSQPHPTRRLD